jgi:hypothetical protein
VHGLDAEPVDARELLVVELEPRGAKPAAGVVLNAAALDLNGAARGSLRIVSRSSETGEKVDYAGRNPVDAETRRPCQTFSAVSSTRSTMPGPGSGSA